MKCCITFSLFLILFSCQKYAETNSTSTTLSNSWYDETRTLYDGIPVTIRFYPHRQSLADEIWSYLNHVDLLFNDYRLDSEIGRINSAEQRTSLEISSEMAEVIQLAKTAYDITHGAIDITIGPLRDLWKQAAKNGSPPDHDKIKALKKQLGLDHVVLSGNTLSIKSQVIKLDVGGIVKGLAADKVMAMMRQENIEAALVQVGGETTSFGLSKKQKPHTIGVQHPLIADALWTTIVTSLQGFSGSTSGNYYRSIKIKEKNYYHIFDPKSGYPASTQVLSSTVLFAELNKCWLTDILDTAGTILPTNEFLPLVEKLGGQALVLVDKDNTVKTYQTAKWQDFAAP